MEDKTISIFYIIDEFFKNINYVANKKARISHSEVVLIGLLACYIYGGNFEKARIISIERGYCKQISRSRFNRRLHKVPQYIWNGLLTLFKKTNEQCFIVDSFPLPVVKNARIYRSNVYKGKEYKGYSASKKEWFYGVKVHMIIDDNSMPVEFSITHGSMHDMKGLKQLSINLARGSTLLADAAYNDYSFEEQLQQDKGITLFAKRKKNAKKPPLIKNSELYKKRKKIETAFSSILSLTGRTIHAVTRKGFELKISLFIFAYALFMIY